MYDELCLSSIESEPCDTDSADTWNSFFAKLAIATKPTWYSYNQFELSDTNPADTWNSIAAEFTSIAEFAWYPIDNSNLGNTNPSDTWITDVARIARSFLSAGLMLSWCEDE